MGARVYKGCLLAAAVLAIALLAAWWILSSRFQAETDQRILAVLQPAFPGAELSIESRDDFPLHQICFEIEVRNLETGSHSQKFAMVQGDSDGGTWYFRGEYPSMAACKANYDRG